MFDLSLLRRSLAGCALLLAGLAGSACEPENPAPDAGTGASCAVTLCPTDTYCDDISGTAECIPLPSCKTVKCSSGYHCELKPVQCIRAPCPEQPQCVADSAGVPCGKTTCAAGLECCNASCGMCVKPGMACIQIACE